MFFIQFSANLTMRKNGKMIISKLNSKQIKVTAYSIEIRLIQLTIRLSIAGYTLIPISQK